jgi:DNA modification methylase
MLDEHPVEHAPADAADDAPEPPKDPVSREGDLWIMGKNRLLCASSLEESSWTKLMEGQTAAMAFSDPPYNVPVGGHVCGLGSVRHVEFLMASGELTSAQFTEFLATAIQHMSAQLKDGAVLALAIDWRHCSEMLSALQRCRLALLNLCVWNKSNGGMGSLYRSKHELFWIAKKGTASHTNNVNLGKDGRYRCNVWDYAGVNSFGKTRMADLADHPTVKPILLVADAIRDVSHPGEIVIDAFIGSGTTILAAERTKRRCFGIELAPQFVDVAIRRWETMTGQRAVLAETGETFAEVAERRRRNAAQDPDSSTEDEEPAEE